MKERAKELRAQGLTQREIGKQLGVSQQTISGWLGGARRDKTIVNGCVPLTQGRSAFIDDDFARVVGAFRWYAMRIGQTFYAVSRVDEQSNRYTYLHHFIFELLGIDIPEGMTVDHADRDGLNNRLDNLRLATQTQQNWNQSKRANNKSGYIGVSFHKTSRKWVACACLNGTNRNLGYFDDPISAAIVRDEFIKKHRGDFAVLNFRAA